MTLQPLHIDSLCAGGSYNKRPLGSRHGPAWDAEGLRPAASHRVHTAAPPSTEPGRLIQLKPSIPPEAAPKHAPSVHPARAPAPVLVPAHPSPPPTPRRPPQARFSGAMPLSGDPLAHSTLFPGCRAALPTSPTGLGRRGREPRLRADWQALLPPASTAFSISLCPLPPSRSPPKFQLENKGLQPQNVLCLCRQKWG